MARWIFFRPRFGACLGLIVALASGCALAPQQATIEAIAYAPLPTMALLRLDPPASSDARAQRLWQAVRAELTRRGFALDPAAPVALAYRLQTEIAPAQPPDIGLGGSVGSSGRSSLGLSIGLPVAGDGDNRHSLRITLTGPSGPLWYAHAQFEGGGDPIERAIALAPMLLDRAGQDLDPSQVSLPPPR